MRKFRKEMVEGVVNWLGPLKVEFSRCSQPLLSLSPASLSKHSAAPSSKQIQAVSQEHLTPSTDLKSAQWKLVTNNHPIPHSFQAGAFLLPTPLKKQARTHSWRLRSRFELVEWCCWQHGTSQICSGSPH